MAGFALLAGRYIEPTPKGHASYIEGRGKVSEVNNGRYEKNLYYLPLLK
jgi:hypothetical protein